MISRDVFEILQFKGSSVRVINDIEGKKIYLSLSDLCQIIKHPQLATYNRAKKLCSSYCKKIFQNSILYAIRTNDVINLVQFIRRGNNKMENICSELVEWCENLKLELPQEEPHDEKKSLQVFNYQDKYSISFRVTNDKTYINATEMAKAFRKQPVEWLRLSSTGEFREQLLKSGKSKSITQQVFTVRGKYGATWIEEELALNFAQWLSPDFSSWCLDRIKDLITQGYAIMPRTEEETKIEVSQKFQVPTTIKEALALALAQVEENEKLKEERKENQHKIDFYDHFIENRDWFKTTTIADELNITPHELHKFLHDNKILSEYETKKKQWVTGNAHAVLQVDVPYLWTNKYGKTYSFGTRKRWTKAGREYIIELWQAKH